MNLSAFDVLQVSTSADDETIRTAYLGLVRENPPDKNPVRFEEIHQAYEQISTQEARLAYGLFNLSLVGLNQVISKLAEPTQPIQWQSSQLFRSLIQETCHGK